MTKIQKINFIKNKLFPLISYVDTNSTSEELYEWADGNLCYHVNKSFISDTSERSPIVEIYARISEIKNNGRTKTLGYTWIYELPYGKGGVDFIDIDGWTCQIV